MFDFWNWSGWLQGWWTHSKRLMNSLSNYQSLTQLIKISFRIPKKFFWDLSLNVKRCICWIRCEFFDREDERDAIFIEKWGKWVKFDKISSCLDFLCSRAFFAWKDRYVEREVQIEFPTSLSGSCGLATSKIHLPLSILVKYFKVPKKGRRNFRFFEIMFFLFFFPIFSI